MKKMNAEDTKRVCSGVLRTPGALSENRKVSCEEPFAEPEGFPMMRGLTLPYFYMHLR